VKLLLDTHAFLWFINGDSNLSDGTRSYIENPDNERLLSIASLWEIAIKVSIGKLEIAFSFERMVKTQIHDNAITILPISASHLDTLAFLPFHHRDPFDRLIIAQSMIEKLTILSRDAAFDAYSIERKWFD